MQGQQRWNNGLLVLGVLVLGIAPLLLLKDAEFGGADSQAEALIQQDNPTYQPWAAPFVEPASGEVESLLFALQAGLGAGVIGYVIGLHRGRKERHSVHHLSNRSQHSSESKDH